MAEKRPRRPSDDPSGMGGQMLVKRPNLGTSTALSRREGSESSALVQSVSAMVTAARPNATPNG